ncbi:MAG: acetyl-CoA C-acyltransferase [Myxococcota bacterium]|jgi:acetyl-CoA acyltransferase|nr:acetyl-CoA C-acyltransferase [Myxococcota bacterium]
MKTKSNTTGRRAVIIGGMRTPFLKGFGDFTQVSAIGLGVAAVRGLLAKFPMSDKDIDGMIWSGVVLPSGSVNVGREILLDLGLPPTIEATTITRACTSSLKAITMAAASIERGEADVIVAGGGDSVSNAEVKMPASLIHKVAPVFMNAKSKPMDYLKLAMKLDLRKDFIPQRPEVKERSTGELMGQSAEKMGARNMISRQAQDAFACQSHHRAAAAVSCGRFSEEVVPVDTSKGKRVFADGLIRGDTSVEKLAKLRPAFAKGGTLTAGNSSPLTDGAAACLIMSEDKARALGFEPLAAFRGWSFDAVDPADQMLQGPAISMPRAAARAGMVLTDFDFIDLHEAFAAQVLSVLKMLGSDSYARVHLDRDKAFGEIDPQRINVHGGSIAIGHPFAATGARMVTTMARELKLSGKATALLGICGAGGVSAGAVLEAV